MLEDRLVHFTKYRWYRGERILYGFIIVASAGKLKAKDIFKRKKYFFFFTKKKSRPRIDHHKTPYNIKLGGN